MFLPVAILAKTATMKSPRATVSQAVYDDAVSFWLEGIPDLRLGLGAKLCSDVRAVTPDVMRFMYPLFERLFSSGCQSGMLEPASLRAALASTLQQRPCLLGGAWAESECLQGTVSHIMTCCALARAYTREMLEGSELRRFPKSGAFRKKMQLPDYKRMDSLASELQVHDRSPALST